MSKPIVPAMTESVPKDITMTSETDVERDMTGETVCGFRVAAWRETHPEHGDKFGHSYSEHWSTPSQNPVVKVERLFTETQLRAALSRAPEAEDLTFEVGCRVQPRGGGAVIGELLEFNTDATGALIRWNDGHEIWKALRNLEVLSPPSTGEADEECWNCRGKGFAPGDPEVGPAYEVCSYCDAHERIRAARAATEIVSAKSSPVALAHIQTSDTYLEIDLEVLDGEHLQPQHSPVKLYLHPSPEMGEISREEIEAVVRQWVSPAWCSVDRLVDAILSILKENGLSREELGGSARASRGAAGPSDCADHPAQHSDGEGHE